MQKKSFLLFLSACAVALAATPVLTSCSDDDDSDGPAGIYPLTLDTPSNMSFDTSTRTLHWDAVPHAGYYTIARSVLDLAPTTVTNNSYVLQESEYDRWNTYLIMAHPAAGSEGNYRQSSAASYTFVCPVNKQLLDMPTDSSFVYDYLGDSPSGTSARIRFSWAPVEHAASYKCEATRQDEGGGSVTTSKTVSDTTTVLSLRRGARYVMSLTACPAENSEEWIASPTLRLYLNVPNGSSAATEAE